MSDQKNIQTSAQVLNKVNREFEERTTKERAEAMKLPYIDLGIFPVNPDVLHVVTEEEVRATLAFPFAKKGKKLQVAVVDPTKIETQNFVKKMEGSGFEVHQYLASQSGFAMALRFFASDQYRQGIPEIKNVVGEGEIQFEKELKNLAQLPETLAKLPAEEALNTLHVSAIKAGASDIHYQPQRNDCLLRFRIDGVLYAGCMLNRETYERLANHLKYKANMTLNVTLPQDGRFRFRVNEQEVDVRVSSLPTEYGEAFVCRILQQRRQFQKFEELGFAGHALDLLANATELNQGTILITGPTSSGKTTTLYVLLEKFNKPEVNIVTLEDPIEYHLEGITQSQVEEKRGYTFAAGLRSIMRQDPDIVMVGEIRDVQTAEVSLQAALTGHVLLTTLHTNSAVEAVSRLQAIGVPPFMIAPALSIVIAQRLVRRICACAEDRPLTDKEKDFFTAAFAAMKKIEMPQTLKKPHGCETCNMTGFRGQLVIAEAFKMDAVMQEAILRGDSSSQLAELARASGMVTMQEDAILKVAAGMTTLEEVRRVVS